MGRQRARTEGQARPLPDTDGGERAPATAFEHYCTALASFDWLGEFVNNARRHVQWRTHLRILHAMQVELDPDGAVWREVMPKNEAGRPMPGAPLPVTPDMHKALSVITGSAA